METQRFQPMMPGAMKQLRKADRSSGCAAAEPVTVTVGLHRVSRPRTDRAGGGGRTPADGPVYPPGLLARITGVSVKVRVRRARRPAFRTRKSPDPRCSRDTHGAAARVRSSAVSVRCARPREQRQTAHPAAAAARLRVHWPGPLSLPVTAPAGPETTPPVTCSGTGRCSTTPDDPRPGTLRR